MNVKNNKSEFARALADLLDNSDLFDRRQWSEVLGVSEPAISQWIGDKTIPRPDNLHMIVVTVERSSGINKGPLRSFRAMAQLTASEVSPHGKRMLPTVWEYMMRPAFSELSAKLARLPIAEQERLLVEMFPDEKPTALTLMDEEPSTQFDMGTPNLTPERVGATRFSGMPGTRVFGMHCGRTKAFMTCFEQEPSSSKDPIAPLRFQLLTDGMSRANEQLYEWHQISTYPRLLIIGEPGSGKTTLFHHLANKSSTLGPRGFIRPLYLHFGCLSEMESWEDLRSVYQNTIPADTDPKESLVFLDAFDEVKSENRGRLGHAITQFLEYTPGVRVVITSRPTPDLRLLKEMKWCKVEPPEESRRLVWICRQLAEKLVREGEDWDNALLSYVSQLRERPDVFQELRTPLLLSHSAQLFLRHSMTAFHEADLFQACLRLLLDDWDEKKNLVRFRNSWARPGHLFQLLSALSYYALIEECHEFSVDDSERWIKKYSKDIPVADVLRVLSETTGVIQPGHAGKWRIAHATFQEYLAAKYVVDSSDDAILLLENWLDQPRIGNVLKYACAVTPDASSLLRFALNAKWPQLSDKVEVLGKIMTQPFMAENGLVEESCDVFVKWLSSSFSDWKLTAMDTGRQIPAARWEIAARRDQRSKGFDHYTGKSLLQSIHAVHRARLSPAKPYLHAALNASKSDVVKELGKSLEVEGYLQAQMLPQEGDDVLVAQVLGV